MRIFYDAVKEIFVPEKPKPPKLPSPQQEAEKEAAAADEASRKARAALAQQERGGRRATLLAATPAQQGQIQTQRRSLFGS